MDQVKKCVILGAGQSMQEGIEKGLWTKLDNIATFGINEAFQFFNPTLITFVDWTFYRDRFDKIKNYPLVIGINNPAIGFWYTDRKRGSYQKCAKGDTLVMVNGSSEYFGKESLKKGCYTGVLAGLFTTTLAMALGYNEIYLLGCDMGQKDGKTHFYQNNNKGIGNFTDENNVERTGVGFNVCGHFSTGVYNNTDAYIQDFWKPYLTDTDVKIYNVSMNSRIDTFEKITYDEFFKNIENEEKLDQNKVREQIRIKIKTDSD
ncbi:MAG: hypothetical protein M0R03_13135 [Novosphingobium sp.]|nr:hypothetical protein [Novosphingobium sp.]